MYKFAWNVIEYKRGNAWAIQLVLIQPLFTEMDIQKLI